MKNITKLFCLASIVFTISSCEMDLLPTTAIQKEEGFKTYADAQKFANGLHAKFRAVHYGIFSYTSEVQGDMFNAAPDFGNRNGSPHRLDGSFTTSDYNLRDVWRPLYSGVLSTNNFLENVGLVTTTTQAQADDIKIYKGYAYFYRAFYYHDLVRRYAVDYEPATAATELGVPIVLKYDVTYKPKRATIEEVYDQIEEDIDSASYFLSLFASTAGTLRAEKPTLDAVKALSARVKFYRHDYANAATLAQEVIATARYTLASSAAAMTAEFVNDNGTESIMQMYASLTETGGNANTIYLNYVNAAARYTPDFIPTQTCVNMYEAADLRYGNWFANFPVRFSSGDANLILFNKYSGNPTLFTAPTRNYMHKVKIFRISEMYLIRAEALLNQPVPDAAGALTALNAIQTARAATLSVAATMADVKLEWAKETIGEGFRIDCLRRWKDGFSGRVPQNNLFVATSAAPVYADIVVASTEPKLTWAIPQTDMDVNPNLIQNEGW